MTHVSYTRRVSIELTVQHAAAGRDVILVELLHRHLLLHHFHDYSRTNTHDTVYITRTRETQYLSQNEAMLLMLPRRRVYQLIARMWRRVESRGSALSR